MTDHQAYSYTVKRIVGEMITLPAVAKEPGKKYTISVETFPEKYTPKRKGLCEMRTFQVLTDLRSGNVFMSEFILNSHFLFPVSTVILTDEYYKFVNVTIPSASSGSAKVNNF